MDAGSPIHDLQQAIVGNGDEGVHLLLESFDALISHLPTAAALEGERLGDHADGQRPRLSGEAGNDRRGACTGAATHPSGDEHHVGAIDHLKKVIARLLGRFGADDRIATGAQALGELVADAHAVLGMGQHECLGIGIDGDEFDALQPLGNHAVDSIAAASPHAQNLDPGKVLHLWH